MSRRLPLAALALAALTAPLARALPPTPLTTYSTSPNVKLVRNVPTGVGVGGKFASGYYFQTTARAGGYGAGDAASDGGLWVFDVKNPEAPSVVAHLPLPIWQNEDVDLSPKRKILLISADARRSTSPAPATPPLDRTPFVPGVLFVYDIADPVKPVLKGSVALPDGGTEADGTTLRGAGHVANCVLDCTYAWVTGSRDGGVAVVDLRDPAAPKVVGRVKTPAGTPTDKFPASTHDVHTDKYGNVWIAGSGGTAMYAPLKDPLKPRLLASTSARDNARTNQLIHHNTVRLDRDHVLVGEEAFTGCGADEPVAYDDPQGGRFQTWRIDLKRKRLVPVALFQKRIPGVTSCSNHWFDLNANRVVADAFYEGGVRFLDVRNPKKPRQVGWFRTSDGAAGQAQFVPGRPDLVYVSDYLRGLDVVKIDAGGKGAKARSEGDDTALARTVDVTFEPSAEWGMVCPVPVVRRR